MKHSKIELFSKIMEILIMSMVNFWSNLLQNVLFALEMKTLFQIRLEITLDVLKNVYHFLKKLQF